MTAATFLLQHTEAVLQRTEATVEVRRNFAKFTGKHLCQGLLFNKVAGKYILAAGGWWIYFGWWWVVMGGGGYILAVGGWWWVMVDIFWLMVGGDEWWRIYLAGGGYILAGGGWW